MYCPNCGNELDDDASFCEECGQGLKRQHQGTKQTNGSIAIPITGFIFAIMALVLFPPVFGGLGIFMGFQTKKHRSESLGTAVIITSALGLVVGMIIGFMTFSNF